MSPPRARVLIIDYEPRSIKQLHDPLERAGYEVLIAKDGIRGIEVFKEEKPDLALIEAMLPKRHGFEVCQELKQTDHGRHTPVVIVTSVYKGRKYRSQAIHHHGCDEYLEKPISPEELLGTVERLLGSGGPGRAADGETVAAAARVAETVPATRTAPAQPRESGAAAADPAPRSETPKSTPIVTNPNDPAESEIVERLNDIFGDNGGSVG